VRLQQDDSYAWDHGDYAAEIDNNWVGFVGPACRTSASTAPARRRDRIRPGANSGQETVPEQSAHNPGPWSTRPTSSRPPLYIAGLHDDYLPTVG